MYSLTVALLVVTPPLLCSTENIYSDVGDEPRPYAVTTASARQNSDREHLGERFPSKRGREVNHDWGAKALNVSLPPFGDGKGSVGDVDAGYMAPRQGTPPPGYHELHNKSTPVVRGQPAASCMQGNLSVESIYLTPISDEEAEEMELGKKDRSGMRGKRNGSFVDDGCYLVPRSCQSDAEDDRTTTEDDGYLAPDSCRVASGGGSMELSTQSLSSLDIPIIYTPATDMPFVATHPTDTPVVATPTADTPVVATPTADTPVVTTPTTNPPIATPSADTPSTDTSNVITPSSEAALDESSKRRTIYAAQKLPPAPPVPDTPVPDL